MYAEGLAANTPLQADVRRRAGAGLVTWAECGGLLWLCRSIDGHRLCGVVPAAARMTERITVGYRSAVLRRANPVAPAGTEVRGHELHYSAVDPAGDALELTGRSGAGTGGFTTPTLLASYLHVHLASRPDLAESFVAAAGRRANGGHR